MFDDGEINLYDLNPSRAEALGRMVMKTPEYSATQNCKITWGTTLEDALEGADVVGVILMAGSRENFALGNWASDKHGFMTSDNVSPNGAFLALKGGPILLDIARKMETICPNAWLIDFANPVAVLSAAVNHYTKIKAMGVCAGYMNHHWDLHRILAGEDLPNTAYDVDVAGINHLSFIIRGSLQGRDLFTLLDERLAKPWTMPEFQPWRTEASVQSIKHSVTTIMRAYRELGVVIFSTEGDGLSHLYYDEAVAHLPSKPTVTREQVIAQERGGQQERIAYDLKFRALLDQDLDDEYWKVDFTKCQESRREEEDIFVRIMKGIAGIAEMKIATSRPNAGAVAGFGDRTVLEYTQYLYKDQIRPAADLFVPDVVHGLIDSLAVHQTMLADAIAQDDPRLLAHALLAYPEHPYSQALRSLNKDLAEINAEELTPALRNVVNYL
jgi:alpha-galactosidase/6-phospho-beta-glucosidase family protein